MKSAPVYTLSGAVMALAGVLFGGGAYVEAALLFCAFLLLQLLALKIGA